jgi:CTP:molybdopterin cytidylyltransferase MocA
LPALPHAVIGYARTVPEPIDRNRLVIVLGRVELCGRTAGEGLIGEFSVVISLILPADLPFIRAEEVRSLLESKRVGPAIDIAATQDGGTGALLLTPPDAIPPLFGTGSFQRHIELAHLRSVTVHRNEAKSFTFDLDTPEDLEAMSCEL